MKKKNDFEFIEHKLNSALNAPESVNEDFVRAALEGSEEKRESNIIPLKKKKNIKALPTVAAAIAVVLIAAVGIGVLPKLAKNPVISSTPSGEVSPSSLTAYENYKQLKEDMKAVNAQPSFLSGRYFVLGNTKKTEDAAAGTELNSNSDGSYGETFTQVEGVDEDDVIKTNGKYIFYAGYDFYNSSRRGVEGSGNSYYWGDYEQSYVFIFSAEGKDSKLINKIKISDSSEYDEINGMYLSGNTLAVLQTENQKTTVKLFDISDIENIKKTGELSQSGYYSASRLIGDKLFVVSNQTAYEEEIPYVICGDEKQDIPATDIYKTENPSSPDFLVVSRIDIQSGDKIEQAKAVFGGSRNIYCNEEHMFVLADISRYNKKTYRYEEKSELFKIDISNGIAFTAAATIKGSAKNQYSMDEHNSVFRIAVTDSDKDGNDINRLYTFDSELNKLGMLDDFAKGEHIEAVKFIDNTAYVITYETTDPLFVIDLSDAKAPQLLGEVKIDGFSTTLIPIGDNLLLGVGTDDNWSNDVESLKLVLFDISDRSHPKVTDSYVCKGINSNAMYNTKEILRNTANRTFTVYGTFYDKLAKHYDAEGDYEYYDYDTNYGCLTFSVQSGKININSQYTSLEMKGDGRCTYIDNTIYLVDLYQHIDCTNYAN